MKITLTLQSGIKALAAALLMSIALRGQTLNTLHSFSHDELGYQPATGVIIGTSGQLYGTTPFGGASSFGLVYQLAPPSSQGATWTEIVLHSFSAKDGSGRPAGLTLGPFGALNVAAGEGGGAGDGGTVFQLKPPTVTNTHWRESILYTFTGINGDGAGPSTAPMFGEHSVLYGATGNGGTYGAGTVYRLVPNANGGAWTEQVLHSFTGDEGEEPAGTLALGSDGTIYGVAIAGGVGGGVAFQLAPPKTPGGSWAETTLYEFGSQSGDSGLPNGVVLGPNGVLYGTAMGDANSKHCHNGCGTVFQLSPPQAPGGPWAETILHIFTGGSFTQDGSQPGSAPVLGPGGVLYGTTRGGGIHNWGTIFEMVPPSSPGGSWTEVILYTFTNGADGGGPNAVTLGADGNLYGTTEYGGMSRGGARNQGTVFQLVLK